MKSQKARVHKCITNHILRHDTRRQETGPRTTKMLKEITYRFLSLPLWICWEAMQRNFVWKIKTKLVTYWFFLPNIYKHILSVCLCENRFILKARIIPWEIFTWNQFQEIEKRNVCLRVIYLAGVNLLAFSMCCEVFKHFWMLQREAGPVKSIQSHSCLMDLRHCCSWLLDIYLHLKWQTWPLYMHNSARYNL